jgi:hypothetical protein
MNDSHLPAWPLAAFRNRSLLTLMLAPVTVDTYAGVLPVQVAACRSSSAGSSCSIHVRRMYSNPVPRGPPKYVRPVAERMSLPIASRPIGSWPAEWQASSR